MHSASVAGWCNDVKLLPPSIGVTHVNNQSIAALRYYLNQLHAHVRTTRMQVIHVSSNTSVMCFPFNKVPTF